MKKIFLLLPCFFFISTLFAGDQNSSDSKSLSRPSFLWKVSKDGVADSYWFGTIHVGAPDVLALPSHIQNAFAESDSVYTEVPMDQSMQMKAFSSIMRNDGKTLENILPEADVQELKSLLKQMLGSDNLFVFQKMKTWAVSVTLPLLPVQMKYQNSQALDQVLYTAGQRSGKKVGGLETVEEQVGYFDQFKEEEQVQMLRMTMKLLKEEVAKGEFSLDLLIDAYVRGDAELLLSEMKKGMMLDSDVADERELAKRVTDSLLYERNKKMVERFQALVKENPEQKNFIAVGTGHLVGEKSVIEGLQDAGFKVSRVTE